MWFYELKNKLHKGLKIELQPQPQVKARITDTKTLVMPLGKSLRRFLIHPEDLEQQFFILRHGDLHCTNSGLVIVSQTKEEANKDDRALVLISRLSDAEEGERIIYEPYRRDVREPAFVHQRLLLFRPGEAIRIRCSKVGSLPALNLRLCWNGRNFERGSHPRVNQQHAQ